MSLGLTSHGVFDDLIELVNVHPTHLDELQDNVDLLVPKVAGKLVLSSVVEILDLPGQLHARVVFFDLRWNC